MPETARHAGQRTGRHRPRPRKPTPLIENSRCLGVVIARGGSKGLPGKNLADLGGRPLVVWSFAAAQDSKYLDHIILSSDDDKIIDVAKNAGCEVPFRRPADLATDEASATDVLLHALDAIGSDFDYLVLLQATSPFRTSADIDACIQSCHGGAPAAVSVSETPKPPEWICRLAPDGRLRPVLPGDGLQSRRQGLAPAYLPNGAVYVARVDWFREHRTFYADGTIGCVMPAARSVDIDSAVDLAVARALLDGGTPAPVEAGR